MNDLSTIAMVFGLIVLIAAVIAVVRVISQPTVVSDVAPKRVRSAEPIDHNVDPYGGDVTLSVPSDPAKMTNAQFADFSLQRARSDQLLELANRGEAAIERDYTKHEEAPNFPKVSASMSNEWGKK